MRRPIVTALILAAGFVLAASPAAAQHRGHNSGHRAAPGYAPSAFDWRNQLDRPGDYRCDAYWDANRTDCGARARPAPPRQPPGPPRLSRPRRLRRQ